MEQKILATGILVMAVLLAACTAAPAPATSVSPQGDGAAGVPTPTPLPPVSPTAPSAAFIAGRVWQDQCARELPGQAAPSTPPPGCVPAAAGIYRANGVPDPNEPGIAGVVVSLGRGQCPATPLAQATTDANGRYRFAGLAEGQYCVGVDPQSPGNNRLLASGGWTFPAVGVGSATVSVLRDDALADLNFGWDPRLIAETGQIGAAAQVVADFLRAVEAGQTDKALTYWNLKQPDAPPEYGQFVRGLVSRWAAAKSHGTVGEVMYAGATGTNDQRSLPENDPRVQRAIVKARVGDQDGAFTLGRPEGRWQIESWMQP